MPLTKFSTPPQTHFPHTFLKVNFKPATRQSGATLLMLMLILVMGASYILVKQLNASVRRATDGVETAKALSRAKNALMGWAINHPINPGTLPFPDRRETSNPKYDGDIDCLSPGLAC